MNNSLLQLMLICGSIRQPSHTYTLTKAVEQALSERGSRTVFWNLCEKPLPIADPKYHHDPTKHRDKVVCEFVELASYSDAFVLASPIYHNSYSGVIKNALDNLTLSQFYYKPVGLVSHGGYRSTQAVDHLRTVVRGLMGIAIPTNVCTADQDYLDLDKQGYEITSGRILERIERLTNELIMFANQLHVLHENLVQV